MCILATIKKIRIIATTIKSIPVLNGETAERFIKLAESNNDVEPTVISAEMRDAISKMMERSRNFRIKTVTE